MILDYNYSKYQKKFSLSYIDESGNKRLWTKNVQRFKSYKYNPDGKFDCWDGRKCEEYWTEDPKGFDIKTFMRELPEDVRKEFFGKTFPNMYVFDIETEICEDFPDPSINPITAISVCSPSLDTLVFGTREMTPQEIEDCSKRTIDYITKIPYFKETGLGIPKFSYIYFKTEEEMLKYFLEKIVANVPVLSGWNCVNFDWWYIVNRIRKAFPGLNIAIASCIHQTENRTAISNFGAQNERLPMPVHTYICDMMEIIQWDHTVMPIKDNVSLDYIAKNSVGSGKIKYKGDLQKLFETDYPTYVFYNAIDSVLVQLIAKKFKTIDVFYIYSLYTGEKIEKCFGQIALSEALVWNYFYEHGKKVVEYDVSGRPASAVVGAYVKQPKCGLYQFITCNDFASLYPSSIITTNISFENYVGAFYDEAKLEPYKRDKSNYVVICASVYKNDGEKGKGGRQKAGELIGTFLDEAALEKYRKDPNYFVSVNGHVYRNDKAYAFKEIQAKLKANRNVSKYLSKQLDAEVMLDCEHLKKGREVKFRKYSDNLVEAITSIGFRIQDTEDLKNLYLNPSEFEKFVTKLDAEIKFRGAEEQGMKLMGNAMYGGTGNVSFFWFSNELANDVTGEARNLIHLMERHLRSYFKEHWLEMTDWHQKWGIIVDPNACVDMFQENYDPIIYGDSVTGDTMLRVDGEEISIEDLYMLLEDTDYWHGKECKLGEGRCIGTVSNGKYIELPIKRVIRHGTEKQRWNIVASTGEMVTCTNDHSIIIVRNGDMVEVKPSDILITDRLIRYCKELGGLEMVKIICVEPDGQFQGEYVYDIEVDTDDPNCHCFFANDILVHNTDSLYIEYESLMKTCIGYDQWTDDDKLKFVLNVNLDFLNQHNREFMDAYFKSRHADSIQNFELETVAKSGVWLNVKKRYAQILLWKDGKFFDSDSLPLKVKGLEIIKSSYPEMARKSLKEIVKFMLENSTDPHLVHRLNILVQEYKDKFYNAPVDEICGTVGLSNYSKFVMDDSGPSLITAKGTPYHIRAAGNYNWIRNKYRLSGDPLKTGKVKWYKMRRLSGSQMVEYFAYPAGDYPDWADQYAPIARDEQFRGSLLEPLNRIITSIGMPEIRLDGSVQMTLDLF